MDEIHNIISKYDDKYIKDNTNNLDNLNKFVLVFLKMLQKFMIHLRK